MALTTRKDEVTQALRLHDGNYPVELIMVIASYDWTVRLVFLSDNCVQSLYLDDQDRLMCTKTSANTYAYPVKITYDPDKLCTLWDDTLAGDVGTFASPNLGWYLIRSVVMHPATHRPRIYMIVNHDVRLESPLSSDPQTLDCQFVRMIRGEGWTRPGDLPTLWNDRYLPVNTDAFTRVYDAWTGLCTEGLYRWKSAYAALSHPVPVAYGTESLDLYTPTGDEIVRVRVPVVDIEILDREHCSLSEREACTEACTRYQVDSIPAAPDSETSQILVGCGDRLYALSSSQPIHRYRVEFNDWTALDASTVVSWVPHAFATLATCV